ncbi:hypothetical protein WA026_004968 [Henosepilachna vigintioctopunctata]|uniref:Origin recognition complex subunit 1 n=1 Tax=Henosepilachna vigintioctopunctata TaxID=420089 RepID=A0AAW1UNE5_9CUCU
MSLRKKVKFPKCFSWKNEVNCYYESALLDNLDHCKFYNSFVFKNTDYKVGDFVFIGSSSGLRKICSLDCLFESQGNKAIASLYEFAFQFKKYFRLINVAFDEENEVVLETKEKVVLDLNNIIDKCRVIYGHKDETVSDAIDFCNLNREIYFLCRYKHVGNGKLVPVISGSIVNDITIVEEEEDSFHNETPLRKVSNIVRDSCPKKILSESMEVDEDFHFPRLEHVKKNLNKSFNESLPKECEVPLLNYSIVKQSDEASLKIRLKVSNGKVLSNIPSTQPIVLVDTLDNSKAGSKKYSIYEIKSPEFKNILENETQKNGNKLSKTSKSGSGTQKPKSKPAEPDSTSAISSKSSKVRRGSCNQPETPDKPSKLSDLSCMVKNLKINDRPCVKVSPRKLRKLSKPLYNENYSDSDSESYTKKRKSVRNRLRTNDEPLSNKVCRSREKFHELKDQRKHSIDSSENELEDNIVTRKSARRKLNVVEDEYCQTASPIHSSKNSSSLSKLNTNGRIINTPKSNKILKSTPLKLIREGVLTPTIDKRKRSVMKVGTPLILARNNLHVSYVPTVLPCRETEYADVYSFIEGKLLDKCGGCMYISGVPGTGKTATVTVAIENLISSWKNKNYPAFNYITVNGMRLTEPRQCYVEILKQLSGKRVPWEQALAVLEEKFTKKSVKKVVPTVLLVDELDILCTKRQDVVYNLLDWPTKANAQLIVVTIANTMDLPERLLMSRVTSRLGLTRLTFQAYTHKQLQEIVLNRLTGNNSFKSDAVQFVARKVASVSGDARRALDICRRSAEIAEIEGSNTQVTMRHVNAALEAMITQPKVKAITHCSRLEKLLLQSIVAEVERTGIEETLFGDVYSMLVTLSALEGFKMVSVSLMASAVYRLTSSRLLLTDQKCVDFNQRIILNVSADDIYYALKKE